MNDSEDPGTIRENEFHPAARSAYRWLKGFMVTNPQQYLQAKEALAAQRIDSAYPHEETELL